MSRKDRGIEPGQQPGDDFPDPGVVLSRLRRQRGLSLRDVAQACGVSESFLGSVERGESDISVRRLARVARVFDHDVGSFLGFSPRRAEPRRLEMDERIYVDRGKGVTCEVIRVPGLGIELSHVRMEPMSGFRSELSHEGMDVTHVIRGTVTARYDGVDYELEQGACITWAGARSHSVRNDTDSVAEYVGVVTSMVH